MERIFLQFFLLSLVLSLSCSSKGEDEPNTPEGPSPGNNPSQGDNDEKPKPSQQPQANKEIIRGRWLQSIGSSRSTLSQFQYASGTQTIGATIPAAVTFTLSTTNFTTPAPSDLASYGTLDVSALRDNNLRVCGASGTAKCTLAGIRIYTTGTPQAGLWNADDEYGAPILTGTKNIGLNVSGAAIVKTIAIAASKRNVRLADFVASGPYAIPISVDFSDAGAGSYSSTLVVEYYLQ